MKYSNSSPSNSNIDDLMHDAFVGLWTKNIDGELVELDDKYGVLRADLMQAIQQELLKARIDELSRFGNQNKRNADIYYNSRKAELQNKLEKGKL